MKAFVFSLSLLASSMGFADLLPADSPNPSCYTGDVEVAMLDLLQGDYDPIFSEENSFIDGVNIHAVQIDENGEDLVTQIVPCQ